MSRLTNTFKFQCNVLQIIHLCKTKTLLNSLIPSAATTYNSNSVQFQNKYKMK